MPGNPQTAVRFIPPKAQGVATSLTSRRPVRSSRRTLAEVREAGRWIVRATPLDSKGKPVSAFDLASRIRGISAKASARDEPLAFVDPEDASEEKRLDADVAPERSIGVPDLADSRDGESANRAEPPHGYDEPSDTTSVLDFYAGTSDGQRNHKESVDAPASEPGDAERPEFGTVFDRTGLADLPLAAIGFATDPDTEHTLRESLQHRDLPFFGCQEPQIRHGDLRAAINALSKRRSVKLAIVDIDGSPYPVGAFHEMAGICEVGTIVIAVGSTDSAKLGRELLIAGVSDYLVKPIAVDAVLEAIDHATAPEEDSRSSGTVAGFVGTGGSGSTTLAVAVAIDAARQGRYVSVLDLNRTVAAAAVALDVEPPSGLDQLFELAAHGSADLDIVERVKASRSDRIAIYAYGQNAVLPAIPDVSAVDWLVTQLSLRSQLVVLDGLDDPVSCIDVLAKVDTPVLVYEPTYADSRRAARMLDLLRDHPALVLVENCARSIGRKKRAQAPDTAGPGRQPDVVVPFEPSLPEISNRGWPEGRLPRSLRKPLDSLVGRILAPPVEGASAQPQSLSARRA